MTNAAAELVDYLCETRHLTRDEQINGIYKRWPDITPEEYVTTLKNFHKRELAAWEPVKRRFPEILSRLKNKSGYMTKATFLGVSWKKENGSWCGMANWSL